MVSVAQLVEPRIVVPVVVGSSPIVHPNILGFAKVAELVDALDLGSSELCSWRFDSSHPHYVLIISLIELLQPILLNLQ